jgi:hypothetical protein
MKAYIQGLITGGVLVFTSLVLIGAQQKSPNIYVTEKEFYEIIDAVINNQNFDKKLFEIQKNITNNRFNKIIDYLNDKLGDDLSITKEFIDLYYNTITL